MAEETPAKAASDTATAAALIAAGNKPQPDVGAASLEQLDQLFTTGSAELPHTVSGEGEPTGKVEDPPAKIEPKPGEEPATGKVDEPVVVEEEVVEETRSPEEIEQAKAEARKRVADEGGDEAAQEAAAAEAAEPVKAEEVVEEEVVEEEEAGPKGIERPRLKDPVDQQIAYIFKVNKDAGTPISWAEAEKRVKGEPPAPAEPVKVEPPVDHAKIVGDLETEVAALEKQLAEKGEAEGNFDAAAAKLVSDLAEKKGDLKLAKRDMKEAEDLAKAQDDAARAESETNRTEAHKTALGEYPDVADKTTVLGKAVADRIAAMKKNPKHPDRPILFADSAPLTIVRMVAGELGIAPVKKVTPPAKPKVVAPLRKVVSPAPGGKSSAAAPAKTPEEAKKQTVEYLKNEASLEELDNLFGMGDPAKLLAGAIR